MPKRVLWGVIWRKIFKNRSMPSASTTRCAKQFKCTDCNGMSENV